ncbi:MAG: ATP-binding protein [Pseudomonadota bacterium]
MRRSATGRFSGHLLRLAAARLLVAAFLLVAAVVVQLGLGNDGGRLTPLYAFTAAIFLLTGVFLVLARAKVAPRTLAYAQLLVDILLVSGLIHATGAIESPFSFLYFPAIIAASAVLYRRGGLTAASLSTILYGAMVDLNYYGIVGAPLSPSPATSLLYRVLVHTAAFYAVAYLSSYLAEEAHSSARKLSAKQLEVEQLEQFNHYVIESMTSGLVTVDVAGCVTSANGAAERILGLRLEQVMACPIGEFLPEIVGQIREPGAEPPGEVSPPRGDLCYARGDGSRLYLGFSISSLRDSRGNMIGHILIFRDLTRLRQMETQVKQLDKLAAIGELAAGLAHEIRNPLASISGGVQLLRSEPDTSPENRRLLGIVTREVRRLNGLIDDFLMFARPGERPRERMNLAAAVLQATELEEEGKGRLPAGVVIERRVQQDLWLEASPEEMRQVLSNLIGNALEAMPGGGVLKVEAKSEAGWAKLAIHDTGAGIRCEDMGRIFLPFFTRKERGTGLGLAIVHAIVERHGGQIDVESAPGATCFKVYLPGAQDTLMTT